MIQSLFCENYKGYKIYKMHDTGAIYYEIDILYYTGNISHYKPHYFNTLQDAKIFVDNL